MKDQKSAYIEKFMSDIDRYPHESEAECDPKASAQKQFERAFDAISLRPKRRNGWLIYNKPVDVMEKTNISALA